MSETNAYAPPKANTAATTTPVADNPYQPCPSCSGRNVSAVGMTWWGGVIGPKILSHVKCNDCRTTFNGKTGQSNTTGIVIYTVVVSAIVLALMLALR